MALTPISQPCEVGQGSLRISSFAARQAGPVAGAVVHVVGSGVDITRTTDAAGLTEDISIPAPPAAYSLDENNTDVQPYATVDLTAQADGYSPISIKGVQIFDGQISLAALEFVPLDPDGPIPVAFDETVVPVHHLFAPGGASGPRPLGACVPRVLEYPIIPDKITVHLGRPTSSAKNVTVSFRDYIANVASSEVYPTWGEATMHADKVRMEYPYRSANLLKGVLYG